jgi:hypothetical protein
MDQCTRRIVGFGVQRDAVDGVGLCRMFNRATRDQIPPTYLSSDHDRPYVLFFSTFSTPMLSAALTFALFVVGHFSSDLRHFEQVVDSRSTAALARGLYWVLPNLAQFDVRSQVVHAQPIQLGYMLWTMAYAGLYIAVLLLASIVIFSRRDFT